MLKRLTPYAPLAFAAVILAVGIFVSGRWGLYAKWEHFDTFMHFLGGIAAAWLALSLMQWDIVRMTAWKQVLVLLGLATLLAVFWEFAEYLAGFGRDYAPWFWRWFHGGDLADTMLDLVAGMAGALVFALWTLRAERR